MQAGRTDKAVPLAKRIGKSIIRKNTAELRNVETVSHSKDMWSKVRQFINPQTRETIALPGITSQILNKHYAAISTDSSYQPSKT